MSKLLPYLLLLLTFFTVRDTRAQQTYWQQQTDFRIEVTLNDQDHSLDGKARIRYVNNSPDTLFYIWFHVWPNAYKNDHTAFSEQLLQNNRTDFYFSNEEQRGYINRLDFRVNGQGTQTDDHPVHQDILRLQLLQPLYPGKAVIIETPFHVQLPEIFSRSGHSKDFYALTQWFPRPAVYDKDGWHPMPYLDQGEFYNDYGNYEVTITTPAAYTVAAPGKQESHLEGNTRISRYRMDTVTDFAWFAARSYTYTRDSLRLPSGKLVQLHWYRFNNRKKDEWVNGLENTKKFLLQRSEWTGDYPYNELTVAEGYLGKGIGGMEYPALVELQSTKDAGSRETVLEHEIGHSWWYAGVSTNERAYPWMDEGLNSYFTNRYPEHKQLRDLQRWLVGGLESMHLDQPIATEADSFNVANYGLIAYEKSAAWWQQLEQALGQPLFDSCVRTYYNQYRFRHPQPADLQRVFETVSGRALPEFARLSRQGPLQDHRPLTLRPSFIFSRKNPEQYRYINIGPAIGYNHYDGFMAGLFLHNYQLPLPRLRFFLAPLYGTQSKTFNGIGDISYTGYLPGYWHQWQLGLQAARFTGAHSGLEGKSQDLRFSLLAPRLRYQFKEPPLSKRERTIQFRSYFIQEADLDFSTAIDGNDTILVVGQKNQQRYLQQLQMRWADHRILYPYDFQFQAEYQKEFTRLAFTGEYFFNYRKEGRGMRMRLFAGKFFYNQGQTPLSELELNRYALNMTGPNGAEDYTYSNYFIGRNESSGWESQQIMYRDGAFKARTDLLSRKVGKSDNWLSAINLVTDIPDKINPLSLLPVRIPVRLFADIGSFAGAWETGYTEQRILYDAGVQVSFFYDLVKVYIPVVNAKPFRDYNRSVLGDNRFWKTLSFSIDVQAFRPRPLLAKAGL